MDIRHVRTCSICDCNYLPWFQSKYPGICKHCAPEYHVPRSWAECGSPRWKLSANVGANHAWALLTLTRTGRS